jgi:hypothetical protein
MTRKVDIIHRKLSRFEQYAHGVGGSCSDLEKDGKLTNGYQKRWCSAFQLTLNSLSSHFSGFRKNVQILRIAEVITFDSDELQQQKLVHSIPGVIALFELFFIEKDRVKKSENNAPCCECLSPEATGSGLQYIGHHTLQMGDYVLLAE